MLGTKSKFSINPYLIADQYQVIESASSFAAHVHEQPMEIGDKIAQNDANHKIRADDKNGLNTLMLVMFQNCLLVILIHFKSCRNWMILIL